jgi:hypothetical protein
LKQLAKYLLGFSALLLGCSDGDSLKQRNDQDYFPLQVGNFLIYSVEQTEYTGPEQSSFSQYELKTEIVDSFENLEGSLTYVIHRSKRASDAEPWEFINTWSARIGRYEAVVNEENTPFVRITFPATANKEWNGNALNTMPEDFYLLEETNGTVELENGQIFKNCLTINQEEYLDVLSKNERQEVYAFGVGLIYRKHIELQYCDDGDCFGQQEIVSGIEYNQVLKEYGQN